MSHAPEIDEDRAYPCASCGAELHFEPGTTAMRCPYCGADANIEQAPEEVDELDFHTALERASSAQGVEERLVVECPSCNAQTTFEANVTVDQCAFCGSKLSAESKSVKLIKPRSLLPFHIGHEQAAEAFEGWLKGLWFAPGALRKYARLGGLQGLYCPYWTYDCRTVSHYTGQRGEYYYVERSYTTTDSEGRSVRRTRRERRTRWYPASGVVRGTFDDILVVASRSLPADNAQALEPWDLEQLVPHDDRYLSGFKVQSYQVGLEEGFGVAEGRMEPEIRQSVRRDIGGDTQRIDTLDVRYHDITFKHLLLPMWISAYRYRDQIYHFLVNARTGEVQGQRPWSWIKIALTILLAALALWVLASLFGR